MSSDPTTPLRAAPIQHAFDVLTSAAQYFIANNMLEDHRRMDDAITAFRTALAAVPAADPQPWNVDDLMQLVFRYGAVRCDVDRSNSPRTQQACNDAIEAIRNYIRTLFASPYPPAADPQPVAIPDGWKLVPIEPTDSMVEADWDVSMSEAHSNGGVACAAWRAMLEAAPQATYGNGHSGLGWYAHDTDYPEEGAMFLGVAVDQPIQKDPSVQDHPAAPLAGRTAGIAPANAPQAVGSAMTPGPWNEIGLEAPWGWVIKHNGGKSIAYVEMPDLETGEAEPYGKWSDAAKANRLAILAVPDLLNALRETLWALGCAPDTTYSDPRGDRTGAAIDAARAAIAKALGTPAASTEVLSVSNEQDEQTPSPSPLQEPLA